MPVLLDSLLPAYVYAESTWVVGRHRTRRGRPASPARPARSAVAGDDRGEGVISAALAVWQLACPNGQDETGGDLLPHLS